MFRLGTDFSEGVQMQALLAFISGLTSDRRGNVAIVMALCSGVLVTAVGGALDYSRSATVSSELQSALDSGALAAASLTQDRAPTDVVRAYVEAALEDHPQLLASLQLDVNADISLNSRVVTATASVSMPTTILGLVGINSLTLEHFSEAIEQVRDVEISLVLDVSGSMRGSKINALRDAAEEFVEIVLAADAAERTSISVIPYNGGVRTPSDVNDDLIDGRNNERRRSGCVDMGTDYPIDMELPYRQMAFTEYNGDEQSGNNSSSFCPRSNMESEFLSQNEGRLRGLINSLRDGGNTGLDVATMWGARALDPAWRGQLGGSFSDRPASYADRDTIKILVVMTDGQATAQIRTEEYTYYDWRGRRRTGTRSYEIYSARQARENMADACDEAEDNGVQIYTIAFQLSGDTNRDLMRNCANKPQNYYQVENLDIAEAFSSIAADINRLRLTR
ncbi:TadE/TadG family type IV pilus assembly protein [Oceanicaulis alexandrii]|uniref:pilus assembly protein TadG-related protein n=1 Tax=Oceanicaulis alexandrii TaxID=153233 RepID=UPI0035CEA9C8